MAHGSTSLNLRMRAQELESLMQGLPADVFKAAFDHVLKRFEEKPRIVVRTRLSLCKNRNDGIRTILSALGELPRSLQDEIAAAVMEIAARASLGPDE
jgi:hypothetical protein